MQTQKETKMADIYDTSEKTDALNCPHPKKAQMQWKREWTTVRNEDATIVGADADNALVDAI